MLIYIDKCKNVKKIKLNALYGKTKKDKIIYIDTDSLFLAPLTKSKHKFNT